MNKEQEAEKYDKEFIDIIKSKIDYLKNTKDKKCFDLADLNLVMSDAYKQGHTQTIKERIEILRELNHINQTTTDNFLRSVMQEKLDEFKDRLDIEIKEELKAQIGSAK